MAYEGLKYWREKLYADHAASQIIPTKSSEDLTQRLIPKTMR